VHTAGGLGKGEHALHQSHAVPVRTVSTL
jgi:hypothetical protein